MKRTKQNPPATAPALKKGISVHMKNGDWHSFPEATGWGLLSNGGNGVLSVAKQVNQRDAEGNPVNVALAHFNDWSYVGWTADIQK